jgi:hypothetical protein
MAKKPTLSRAPDFLIMIGKSSLLPSSIKNKAKREAIYRKNKKVNGREKLEKRLARAKIEAHDPEVKRVGLFSAILQAKC